MDGGEAEIAAQSSHYRIATEDINSAGAGNRRCEDVAAARIRVIEHNVASPGAKRQRGGVEDAGRNRRAAGGGTNVERACGAGVLRDDH
jgi:hypothetical protein